MEQNEYLQFVKKFIAIDITQLGSKYDEALLIFKNQISYATELNKLITDLFFVYDKTVITTLLPQFPEFKNNINCLATVLSQFETITIDNGNEIVNKVKELSKLSGKDLFMPIRLIAVAKEHGPEMNKILSVVGKQKLLELIKAFNI
jgi:glutamyl/glutaminyl-tRNA synthetase